MTDRGTYMHVSTGGKYFPFDPQPDEVKIETIAHHLATEARFNGATQHKEFRDRIFYSVAEHSVLVSIYVEQVLQLPEFALEALLHDSSEAYIGDLIRPLKYSPDFRAPFLKVEELNEHAHADAFNLVYPYPPAVKIADEAVCAAEVNQMVRKNINEDWTVGQLHDSSRVAPYNIQMLPPYQAKQLFLGRWRQLAKVRNQYRLLPKRFHDEL